MERSWEYVQERIDLLKQMNEGVRNKSKGSNEDPMLMTFMAAPSSGVITRMVAPASQPANKPTVYDETGIINQNVCTSGVCQYVPNVKSSQDQITWIEGNGQVSLFQPPLKVLYQEDS